MQVADDALAMQDAGCFAIVFEAVPAAVTEVIMERMRVPVIGIGAGTATDGQVLVFHDLLGLHEGHTPRFVKRFAAVKREMVEGVRAYAEDVRWSAPRRGVAFVGRTKVVTALVRELAAMADPRVNVLRHTTGTTQSFHEFTIRFHLVAPGIEGVNLPLGAEIELERLRVLTHDADGRIVATAEHTWIQVDPTLFA